MEPGGESLWRKAGLKMAQENLFAALRAAFPANLDLIAVETDHGLNYMARFGSSQCHDGQSVEWLEVAKGQSHCGAG